MLSEYQEERPTIQEIKQHPAFGKMYESGLLVLTHRNWPLVTLQTAPWKPTLEMERDPECAPLPIGRGYAPKEDPFPSFTFTCEVFADSTKQEEPLGFFDTIKMLVDELRAPLESLVIPAEPLGIVGAIKTVCTTAMGWLKWGMARLSI